MKSLHTSLNTTHSGCKPSTSMSLSTHSVTMTNKDPDYITPAIKTKLKLKNKLLQKGQVEKADALSRRIGLEIAKKNSTMAKSLGPSTTSGELWSAVRKLRNRSNNEVRDVAGVDAEALNRHYARISYDSNYIEPRLKHTVNSNSEKQITEYEVFKILDALKKTATGLDKLPAWFLRLGAPVFAKRVTSLFNTSLQEGVVPGQWRRAYIHPIAKTSAPVAPVDYRPISITPVLSRILEKLVVRNFIYPTLPTAPAPSVVLGSVCL